MSRQAPSIHSRVSNSQKSSDRRKKLSVRELTLLSFLGVIMFVSKEVMEFLPNVHLIGVFTVATTAVYRRKALYAVFVFIMLVGFCNGFNTWWLPYFYLWPALWGMTMLLPKNMPRKFAVFAHIGVCGLHGFLYGTLYAPAQAILFGLNFQQTIAWIIAGLPWDAVHGVSNLCVGILIEPIILLLERYSRKL